MKEFFSAEEVSERFNRQAEKHVGVRRCRAHVGLGTEDDLAVVLVS